MTTRTSVTPAVFMHNLKWALAFVAIPLNDSPSQEAFTDAKNQLFTALDELFGDNNAFLDIQNNDAFRLAKPAFRGFLTEDLRPLTMQFKPQSK